jgi:hypothetical protein
MASQTSASNKLSLLTARLIQSRLARRAVTPGESAFEIYFDTISLPVPHICESKTASDKHTAAVVAPAMAAARTHREPPTSAVMVSVRMARHNELEYCCWVRRLGGKRSRLDHEINRMYRLAFQNTMNAIISANKSFSRSQLSSMSSWFARKSASRQSLFSSQAPINLKSSGHECGRCSVLQITCDPVF